MKIKVLVLGGTGMLGSTVVDILRRNSMIELYATARRPVFDKCVSNEDRVKNVRWIYFDANENNTFEDMPILNHVQWVVNCIGMTKPYTHDNNIDEIIRATKNNILLPHNLESKIPDECRILQIATDCVYSGTKGRYNENDYHDAIDVYGKTKSLGEVKSKKVYNLRCSIIGHEAKNDDYLLKWFLNNHKDSTVNGFTNHEWNGITTLHFAKICEGIIINDFKTIPNVQHIIPSNSLTKANMLNEFAKCYNREDITINCVEAPSVVDRTLSTINPKVNEQLWELAGYQIIPTLEEMFKEMSLFDYVFEY